MAKKIDLKKLRIRLDLSQREMADMLGIDQATVSKIENGRLEPSKTLAYLIHFVSKYGFLNQRFSYKVVTAHE